MNSFQAPDVTSNAQRRPLEHDLSPAPSLAESRRDADWAVCGRSVSLPASATAFPSPGVLELGTNPWQPAWCSHKSGATDAPKITVITQLETIETHRVLPFVEVQVPRTVLAQRFVQLWPWPRHGHVTVESQNVTKIFQWQNDPYRDFHKYGYPKMVGLEWKILSEWII